MSIRTTAQPWYAVGDEWALTQTEWDPDRSLYDETVFTQSNGYLGVRGYTEETDDGVASVREGYLAGVFGHTDEAALEQTRVSYDWPMLAMITLPELFACSLDLNGERFRMSDGTVSSFRRSLNMRNGVLTRVVRWSSPRGQVTRLQFERFLSAETPHLCMQRITVTPENWQGTATLVFELDGGGPTYFRCGDRSFPHLPQALLEEADIAVGRGGGSTLTVRTRGTHHTVSVSSSLSGGEEQAEAVGASRLEEDAAGVVHLHDTVGPDELDRHGKDNGYSSLMARRHLRLAARWVKDMQTAFATEAKALVEKLELTATEIDTWIRAADRLAAPMVPGHPFPLQDEFLLAKEPLDFTGLTADEAFDMRHTHRVVKQSDIVLLMYLLQDEFTVEQMREAYDFYEPMTLHYSSLSYNTHAILATKIGRHAQAYDYFLKAAGLDLDDLREATRDGLHAAALGGTWQTLVYGFLGMRMDRHGLTFEPCLPDAWTSVSLHIVYRGYRLHLTFTHDLHRIEVDGTEAQGPAQLTLNGETHTLGDAQTITSSPRVAHAP